jgi:hypothetical protein
VKAHLTGAKQVRALPAGWENMPYQEFLAARSRLIAHVIRDGFARVQT